MATLSTSQFLPVYYFLLLCVLLGQVYAAMHFSPRFVKVRFLRSLFTDNVDIACTLVFSLI